MVANKSFIHLFKTPGGYYIYDVNTNTILKVEKSVYELLCGSSQTGDNTVIERMKADGFLQPKRVEEIIHPSDQGLPYYLDRGLRMITLQVTQQCNLRCEYCIYSGSYFNRGHSNKRMSFETAKKGIDFLINHSGDSRQINVGFYGGEPLLEMELLKKCIEYSEETAEGKCLTFSLTTNGTLISESIIEYFEKHDVKLMISLDGPGEVQDKYRKFAVSGCGTFDRIVENLEKIKSKFPDYFKKITFNIVMNPGNSFSCINEFFVNYETVRNSGKNATFVNGLYTDEKIASTEQFTIERNYEIFKILLSKLKRLDEKYVSDLVIQYFENIKKRLYKERQATSGLPEKGHPGGPCVPGIQRLFMAVNGDLYPCERVSETSEVMKIGNIDTGFDIEKCRKILNIGRLTKESCKNCWAFRYCTICAALADDLKEFSAEKKLMACNAVRFDTENSFRDYCVLKEFGCDFEEFGGLADYNI